MAKLERRATVQTRESRYITVRDLAKRWGISRAHAYRVVERGLLPGAMRIANAIRVPIASVEAFERRSGAA
jgi:predicted DNA-binding transcriptional regulator AlpA